jgi:hypothetical protein
LRPLTELDPVASIVVVSLRYSPLDATANPSQPATKSLSETERAAKFHSGMLEEMGAVGKIDGCYYAGLRELYPHNADNHRFPWTLPMKGCVLPKTQKEFEAEYTKAFAARLLKEQLQMSPGRASVIWWEQECLKKSP